MSLIALRPVNWNEVIGQERALTVLYSLLRNQQFMTRGLIFAGIRGVGKTSSAYLFARALMCNGADPLGCGQCPSCREADQLLDKYQTLDGHPDIIEIDAAKLSGVDTARALVSRAENCPVLGKKRAVIINEAQRQSKEAWDVYLTPLEKHDTNTVYIFTTTAPEEIPGAIDSRCATLRFRKVPADAIVGLLANLSLEYKVNHELSGLRRLAQLANGKPRDAVRFFATVAATGETITPALIQQTLDEDIWETCANVFLRVLAQDLLGAIEMADLACQLVGPGKLIASLFSLYANEVFREGSLITPGFQTLTEMTRFFLKWSSATQLPADAVPLMVVELADLRLNATAVAPPSAIGWSPANPSPSSASEVGYVTDQQIFEGLGGVRL